MGLRSPGESLAAPDVLCELRRQDQGQHHPEQEQPELQRMGPQAPAGGERRVRPPRPGRTAREAARRWLGDVGEHAVPERDRGAWTAGGLVIASVHAQPRFLASASSLRACARPTTPREPLLAPGSPAPMDAGPRRDAPEWDQPRKERPFEEEPTEANALDRGARAGIIWASPLAGTTPRKGEDGAAASTQVTTGESDDARRRHEAAAVGPRPSAWELPGSSR